VAHVYTIGHSRHDAGRFLELLEAAGVTLVVDTRTTPSSRWAPFASRSRLVPLLAAAGIGYAFMGDRLGGRPSDPAMLDARGRPDFAKMATAPGFRAAVGELEELIPAAAVCLLCGEEDPSGCHRTLLVGRALLGRGISLRHIRGNGVITEQPPLPLEGADLPPSVGEL
jgi:uncharacterized protein (DUF488 family)